MVRTPGGDSSLVEPKAVDAAYPLYGSFTLADGRRAPPPAADSLLIGPGLAERLAVGVGDSLRYGTATFRIAGIIGTSARTIMRELAMMLAPLRKASQPVSNCPRVGEHIGATWKSVSRTPEACSASRCR